MFANTTQEITDGYKFFVVPYKDIIQVRPWTLKTCCSSGERMYAAQTSMPATGNMEAHEYQPKKLWTKVPARYVFAIVRVLGGLINSLQGNCMSMAITSMVRGSSPSSANSSAANSSAANTSATILSDVCPVPADSTSAAATTDKEGDFDWDELTQSYVTNGATYGILCTTLIGAYFAQRWSPKTILTYIGLQGIVGTLLTPVLAYWSVYALIVSRVLLGFFGGGSMPASGQLESSWFPPEERQQLSGIIGSAGHIGSIVSSSLTGFLIETYGWEFVFYLYGGISVVPLLLWVIFVHDTPQKHPRISDEEKEYIAARVKKETEVKLPVPWLKIITSPAVWAYLSMSVSVTWLMFIFMTELPTYLKRMLHYSTSKAGYVTSVAHAATVLGQLLSAFFSQWLRSKGYVSRLTSYRFFNAVATLGPTFTLIAITQLGCDTMAIVVLLVLTTFMHGAYVSGSMLNHMDLAINFVPILVGINGTIISTVGILSPTITAAIINNNQTLSAWSKVFYISAAVSAVPYTIFFIFGSADEQPWNKPQFEIDKEECKARGDSEFQPTKSRKISKDCKV